MAEHYGGPLDGIRVLDLTHFIAGPFGTQFLADLGADVVKVEQPEGGDLGRGAGTDFVAGESVHFWAVNRNKRSIVLDLKQDAGRELFLRLVEDADVVFDNFRPGVLERLRIDHATLSAANPRIISTSVSAFGQTGPYRGRPGYDLSIQALSGIMSLTGEPAGRPVRAGVPIGDLVGGLVGALGTLAAVVERERTGVGSRVDVALLDSQVSLLMYWAAINLATGEVPGRVGAGHPTIVPYGEFATKDSGIVVAVFGDRFFRLFCQALGLDELAADPRLATNPGRVRHRAEVERAVGAVLAGRTTAEWVELLDEVGIPCAPVNDVGQVMRDPQVLARDMVQSVEHPTAGPIRLLGNPVKTGSRRAATLPPPLFGQHTREVLAELGLEESTLDALGARRVTVPVSRRVEED
jgi:crotonobetainyl-CoA:carnitine CoA-transferase CaiB-like acyl-CoA transferase